MYADDLVEWLLKITEKSSPSCPIYNVGSDQSILIDKVAQQIATIFGQNVSMQDHDSDYIDRYVPKICKAKKELNLDLKYSLNDAIKKTINSLGKIEDMVKKNKNA
jgi:nucleoside-diphosphate-sugar epimerase